MKYSLKTPIGNIAFTESENHYYNSMTDLEVIELYSREKEKTGFINPHTYAVLEKRNLLVKGRPYYE